MEASQGIIAYVPLPTCDRPLRELSAKLFNHAFVSILALPGAKQQHIAQHTDRNTTRKWQQLANCPRMPTAT